MIQDSTLFVLLYIVWLLTENRVVEPGGIPEALMLFCCIKAEYLHFPGSVCRPSILTMVLRMTEMSGMFPFLSGHYEVAFSLL